jgi:hypothetical protein
MKNFNKQNIAFITIRYRHFKKKTNFFLGACARAARNAATEDTLPSRQGSKKAWGPGKGIVRTRTTESRRAIRRDIAKFC